MRWVRSPALPTKAMDEGQQQGSAIPEEAVVAAPFIQPPKLEDAGLEDCALPPESIMEAFARAAIAARLAVDEDDSDDERSDEDGGASGTPTVVVGAGPEREIPSDRLSVLCEEVSDPEGEERGKERKEERSI